MIIDSAREKKIMRTSATGIITNILLAVTKIILGFISGSVAIMSDAVNNLTDSSSSLITIIGTHLAGKQPTRNHPFGYGRIEYLTSMLISVIVLVTGIEMTITSVKSIFKPEPVDFSIITLVIITITIVVKIWLGLYTKRTGKSVDSGALAASGADAVNDAVVSAVTLASAVFYLITHISIDSYTSTIISLFVIKTGIDVLHETLGKILGERGNSNLAQNIKQEIAVESEIISAHDLILHNYGPDTNTGSINLEIDHTITIGEIYPVLHRLQTMIYQKYHAYIVFGLYAVDNDSPLSKEIRTLLSCFAAEEHHCIGFHGIDIDTVNKQIFCDIILDFNCNHAEICSTVMQLLKKKYGQYQVIVTVDTEFA
jgi:cation diffusion facilitator family transporter